jgi:hypothetical protein
VSLVDLDVQNRVVRMDEARWRIKWAGLNHSDPSFDIAYINGLKSIDIKSDHLLEDSSAFSPLLSLVEQGLRVILGGIFRPDPDQEIHQAGLAENPLLRLLVLS